MSDYNPTITVQYRDYRNALTERDAWHQKVNCLKEQGVSSFEAVCKAGHMHTSPLVTEVRPNPLSVELRIVLCYFWTTYNGCLKDADRMADKHPLEAARYYEESLEVVNTVCDLCYMLFAVTSPHAPVHIHSEHGCNDETCPAWVRGEQAARDNVADWYTPDC